MMDSLNFFCQINGKALVKVKHATAVELFVSAGEMVELLVWPGAEKYLVVSCKLDAKSIIVHIKFEEILLEIGFIDENTI